MSYADAQLDLTSIGVACMSGANGAGKSALLDAFSWALWDIARAQSDELIRLGQTEMKVDVCFGLEGHIYRVRRSRQRIFGKAGQRIASRGTLDLHVWSGDDNGWCRTGNGKERVGHVSGEDESSAGGAATTWWISLNASSMRDTQDRLRDLLRMDYNSFVSSVYLRQGRADEFTIRSASERKQVLAEILGLDYFDRLQELARQEARDHKVRVQMLETALSLATEVEKGFVDSLAELEDTKVALKECELDIAEMNEQIEETKVRLSDVSATRSKREAALLRTEELKSDRAAMKRRYEEASTRLHLLCVIIAEQDTIKAQSEEFQSLKVLVEEMDNIAMRFHELNSRRLELRSKIATARGRMEVEIEHFDGGLKELLARKAKLEKSIRQKDDIEEAYRAYKRLVSEEQDMARRRESFASLSVRVEELHTMVVESRLRLEAEIQQRSSMLEDLEQLIKSREVLGLEQNDLKSKAEELDRLENEFELVEERGLKLKAQHDALSQQVLQKQKHIRENEEKSRELLETPDLSSCPLCRSPIADRLAVMQRYQDDTMSVNREIDSLRDRMETIEDERTVLRRQYIDLRNKLELRSQLDTRIGEFNEKQSALDRAETSRDELRKGLELARRKMEEQAYAQIERESLVRIKGEIARLEFDPIIFSNLQSQIRAQRHAEFRWQQLHSDMRELVDLEREIPEKEKRIEDLNLCLKEESFEEEARDELAELEGELKLKPYDRELHQARKQRLSQLIPAAERLNDLNRALMEGPLLEASILEMDESLKLKTNEVERIEAELGNWSEVIAQQGELETQLQTAQEKFLTREGARSELARKESSLSGKLEQLKSGKDDLDAKRCEMLAVLDEMNELQRLVEIYGKKGIQAVIIDNAIPEIEAEANRVLSRLSENRMHVALVTQHRSARGNPIETLDILIADEQGTRSYELYSGGETFKVNFSLRVALSRLLTRRAGARLETLIIDEGFGSQDEQSRERLIRAINSIRNDFARILVVTHIAEVKDMFPVQIMVNKVDGVSQVQLASL